MADKAITDLTQAQQITDDDLFVLEQSGEAKKLKGSQVVQYAKDAVAEEVQGVKEYADNAKESADAAAASAAKAASAAEGIDDKVDAADASAKAAAASAAAAASSATGVDAKVQAAQTAADNSAKSETAAKNAQTAAANAQKAAESAQTGAQTAKTAAESAQGAAESAKDAAAGSATAAGQKATQAAQSAEDAASAKSAAETAKTDAQAARDAIVNMIVDAVTVETGKPATVSKSLVDNVYKLVFGLPRGETGATGPQGATGNGISGIALKSGNHAPGTSDVYTITLTDGTTFDFAVYNGANGAGAGDMLASVYDPQGKHTDIFAYVDDAIGAIPTPDVSAQIKAHNESEAAHPYIRGLIPTKTSQLTNDSGYLTQHQDISGKLDKDGDGSNVTAAFSAASTRANIATGEKLSVLFGKVAKWLGDLKALAFKDTVAKTDLAEDVQESLGKADSALQSAPVTSVNGQTGDVEVDAGVQVPSTTDLLKGNGSGGIEEAEEGVDYVTPGQLSDSLNSKADSDTVENHANDTVRHIIAKERSAWNDAVVEATVVKKLPVAVNMYGAVYGQGKFVVTGTNTILYSYDNIEWVAADVPVNATWYAVTYLNGVFVAVGTSAAVYSTDGITWVKTTMPYSVTWRSVASGNNLFIAISTSSDKAAYSTDGITWYGATLPMSAAWRVVTYGAGKFIAFIGSNGATTAAYTTDGITWVQVTLPVAAWWMSCVYADGKFVAVGLFEQCVHSSDGLTWTSYPTTQSYAYIFCVKNTFVAFRNGATVGFDYSVDAITWTLGYMPASKQWISAAVSPNLAVAVNNSGTSDVAYSIDGITWSDGVLEPVKTKDYVDEAISSIFEQIAGYDPTKTQTLQNAQGTIKWVTS